MVGRTEGFVEDNVDNEKTVLDWVLGDILSVTGWSVL